VACGAAAVPARVIRLDLVATLVARGDMSAQCSRTTACDRTEGPMLLARQGGPIACEEGSAMLAHHIGDCEGWATHGSLPSSAGNARASKGLSVAWSAGWATWRERLVLRRLACPSSNWMRRRATPASSRWVAKLCLRRCGYTALVSLAVRPAWVQIWATPSRVIGSVT